MNDDQRADTPRTPTAKRALVNSGLPESTVEELRRIFIAIEAEAAADPADSRAGKGERLAAEPPDLFQWTKQALLDAGWQIPLGPDGAVMIQKVASRIEDAMAAQPPAAAEPPAPTGDNDADTQALIEAWGEPEVQAEGMSVKQWEQHVADLRERAAHSPNPQGEPPRGSLPPGHWEIDSYGERHWIEDEAGGSLTATDRPTASEEPPDGH